MATINLGAIKFNWKGAYNSSTSYAVDDVVSSGGNSYVCIQAHSNQAVGDATAYWNIMSSAGTNGTNGTDVGTTLTTQGDILYRDGSGLQRLPKGTANQVLKMNSGATAPEYGNLSSDFVKLASVNSNDVSASTYTFDNCFTEATYQSYQLHLNITFSNQNHPHMRFLDSSGSVLSGSNDYKRCGYQGYRAYTDNSSSTLGAWNDGVGTNAFHMSGWNINNNSQPHSIICDFVIPKPTESSLYKSVHTRAGGYSSGNWFFGSGATHQYTGSSAVRGFNIFNPAGNITKLYATLYGLKK